MREEALTTKLRVVFDRSAKVKPDTLSLNKCLHTDLSLLLTIADILLRFRYHQVALVADIDKAFHMLSYVKIVRDVKMAERGLSTSADHTLSL